MQTDFLWPIQAAALKHHPAATDFDRGEAPRTVALGGLEAFRSITQTGQLSICERDMSSVHQTLMPFCSAFTAASQQKDLCFTHFLTNACKLPIWQNITRKTDKQRGTPGRLDFNCTN